MDAYHQICNIRKLTQTYGNHMIDEESNLNLMEPDDVAYQLGISKNTLSVWRATGRQELPFVKVGRLVKYRQADVSQYIRSRMRNCTHGTNMHDAVLQRAV